MSASTFQQQQQPLRTVCNVSWENFPFYIWERFFPPTSRGAIAWQFGELVASQNYPTQTQERDISLKNRM